MTDITVTNATLTKATLEDIRDLIRPDLLAVDALISERLASKIPLIQEICQHIINSGGKRLRPLLVLLCSKAFDYQGDKHILQAAIIEFVHTATLLHDDVVDASELRRNKQTANVIWGNEASVLVGDFLYSRAFQMMVDVGNLPILAVLAEATNSIAQGEVLQLLNCNNPDTTAAQYMKVIRSKTAKLFEAATKTGAMVASCPENTVSAIAEYGIQLGTAFQLIDDVLDYSAPAEEMGKNSCDDLAEGKPTLPLIYALQHCNDKEAELIRQAIREGGLEQRDAILSIIHKTEALDYTTQVAHKHAQLAAKSLNLAPDSPYKEALIALTQLY